MTRIICRQHDCVFWDEGICSSDEIIYDPEDGCLTFEGLDDMFISEEDEWDEDLLDDEDLNDLELDEDDWDEEEDEFILDDEEDDY